jgi:diguanylate cyclase (GGDEF)-like protein
VVYRARWVGPRRSGPGADAGEDYAIKVLACTPEREQEVLVGLRREAALLASIADPGLPRVHEVGVVGGQPYLIMDLVTGRPLAELIEQSALPPERAVSLALDIVTQLTAIHRKGLVHRDLKPENVIVGPDGAARLIDFGLAAWEASDAAREGVVGTLAYAAPEQSGMLRRPVDNRSDLYSVGVLLFECLTGRLPFDASDVGELLRMHAVAPPPDLQELAPRAGPTVAAIVATLLAKDPDDRYQDGQGLIDDLRAVAADPRARFEPRFQTVAHAGVEIPLSGRRAELDRLAECWAEVGHRRGGAAVVRGPAGTGKTRLSAELAARAQRQGALVLHGKSTPGDPLPYAPLRDAVETYLRAVQRLPAAQREPLVRRLRQAAGPAVAVLAPLSPTLAAVLGGHPADGTDGADQFAAAVTGFLVELATQHDGLLLRLDDVQWLDAGTLQVLVLLADQIADVPLLVLVTARDDPASTPSVETAVRGLGAAVRCDLTLPPLDSSGVAQLAAGQLPGVGSAATLAQLTVRGNGNPFVILEYLRAVVDAGLLTPSWGGWLLDQAGLDMLELPRDAIGLVLARVDGLGPASHELLTLAALLGNRFRADELAVVAGRPVDDVLPVLVEAAARRLIEPREDAYAFLHDRIREALLDVDADTLGDLHQRAAEALHGLLPADGAAPAELVYAVAHHYLLGHPQQSPERGYAACVAAARLALADVVPNEAVTLLRYAATLPIAADGDFLDLFGTALRGSGQFTEALGVLAQALDLHSEPLRRAATLYQIAECHRATWQADDCRAALHRAMAELGNPWPRNRLWLLLSTVVLFVAGLFVRRTRIGFGAASGSLRERYLLESALFETGVYVAYIDQQRVEPVVIALRAPYRMNRLGLSPQYVRNTAAIGMVLQIAGLRRAATANYARAAVLCSALEDPGTRAYLANFRGAGAYIGGDDEGELWATTVLDHGRYLDAGIFSDDANAIAGEEFRRGRVSQFAGWLHLIERRLIRDGAVETLSASTVAALEHALAGRHAEAATLVARSEVLIPAGSSRGLRINQLLAKLDVYAEQQEIGAPFDECVAEFAAMRLKPAGVIRSFLPVYLHLATGRLAQCRVATDTERTHRLAAARSAVKQFRRAARGALLTAYATVAEADLAVLEGKHQRALRLLERLPPLRPAAPRLAFEAARALTRALPAIGYVEEAGQLAQYAQWLAGTEGWPHRVRWITAEFGVETISAGTLVAASHGTSTSSSAVGLERLRALEAVGRAASRIVDPDELARIALDETIRILHAERAFLFLTDEDGTGDHLVQHLGRDAAGQDLTTLTGYSVSLVERVRTTREPIVVTGTEEGAALGAESAVLHGLRSIMVAPLHLDNRLLGVVYLDSQVAKGIFTADDAGVLTALTNHIATALETARAAQLEVAVQTTKRERDLSETLRTSLEHMSDTLQPRQVLTRLLDSAAEISTSSLAWLLLDAADGITAIRPGADDQPGEAGQVMLTADPDLGRLVAAGPVVGVVGGPELPATLHTLLATPPAGVASWLALPLDVGDTHLGVLLLASDRPNAYPDGVLGIAATVVAQGMTAYDRAALFARVQELAATDELTGIANRRHFFELGERDLAAAVRHNRPLAAAMVDIDHFKAVNDTHGHPTGDDVIRGVAGRLAAQIRTEDIIGRYGGEEFALLLPYAATQPEIFERLRRAICATPVPTRSGPLTISVSIGVAYLSPAEQTLDELLARADSGLYLAKESGRNRVEITQSTARR